MKLRYYEATIKSIVFRANRRITYSPIFAAIGGDVQAGIFMRAGLLLGVQNALTLMVLQNGREIGLLTSCTS